MNGSDGNREFPVLVIDLSPASVEAMVEKATDYVAGGGKIDWSYNRQPTPEECAREALASLGITAGKRGRKL